MWVPQNLLWGLEDPEKKIQEGIDLPGTKAGSPITPVYLSKMIQDFGDVKAFAEADRIASEGGQVIVDAESILKRKKTPGEALDFLEGLASGGGYKVQINSQTIDDVFGENSSTAHQEIMGRGWNVYRPSQVTGPAASAPAMASPHYSDQERKDAFLSAIEPGHGNIAHWQGPAMRGATAEEAKEAALPPEPVMTERWVQGQNFFEPTESAPYRPPPPQNLGERMIQRATDVPMGIMGAGMRSVLKPENYWTQAKALSNMLGNSTYMALNAMGMGNYEYTDWYKTESKSLDEDFFKVLGPIEDVTSVMWRNPIYGFGMLSATTRTIGDIAATMFSGNEKGAEISASQLGESPVKAMLVDPVGSGFEAMGDLPARMYEAAGGSPETAAKIRGLGTVAVMAAFHAGTAKVLENVSKKIQARIPLNQREQEIAKAAAELKPESSDPVGDMLKDANANQEVLNQARVQERLRETQTDSDRLKAEAQKNIDDLRTRQRRAARQGELDALNMENAKRIEEGARKAAQDLNAKLAEKEMLRAGVAEQTGGIDQDFTQLNDQVRRLQEEAQIAESLRADARQVQEGGDVPPLRTGKSSEDSQFTPPGEPGGPGRVTEAGTPKGYTRTAQGDLIKEGPVRDAEGNLWYPEDMDSASRNNVQIPQSVVNFYRPWDARHARMAPDDFIDNRGDVWSRDRYLDAKMNRPGDPIPPEVDKNFKRDYYEHIFARQDNLSQRVQQAQTEGLPPLGDMTLVNKLKQESREWQGPERPPGAEPPISPRPVQVLEKVEPTAEAITPAENLQVEGVPAEQRKLRMGTQDFYEKDIPRVYRDMSEKDLTDSARDGIAWAKLELMRRADETSAGDLLNTVGMNRMMDPKMYAQVYRQARAALLRTKELLPTPEEFLRSFSSYFPNASIDAAKELYRKADKEAQRIRSLGGKGFVDETFRTLLPEFFHNDNNLRQQAKYQWEKLALERGLESGEREALYDAVRELGTEMRRRDFLYSKTKAQLENIGKSIDPTGNIGRLLFEKQGGMIEYDLGAAPGAYGNKTRNQFLNSISPEVYNDIRSNHRDIFHGTPPFWSNVFKNKRQVEFDLWDVLKLETIQTGPQDPFTRTMLRSWISQIMGSRSRITAEKFLNSARTFFINKVAPGMPAQPEIARLLDKVEAAIQKPGAFTKKMPLPDPSTWPLGDVDALNMINEAAMVHLGAIEGYDPKQGSVRKMMEKDPYSISRIIGTDKEISARFLQNLPPGVDIGDVMLALVTGSLRQGSFIPKAAEGGMPIQMDASGTPPKLEYYSPSIFPTRFEGQALETIRRMWDVSRKTPGSTAERSGLLRWYLEDPALPEKIGADRDEFIQVMANELRVPKQSLLLQEELNRGLPHAYQRFEGFIRSSAAAVGNISRDSLNKLTGGIYDLSSSKPWQPNDPRNQISSPIGPIDLHTYIYRAIESIDTNIDWTGVKFQVYPGLTGAWGEYIYMDRTIRVGQNSANTVVHEMGHYLNHMWMMEALGFDPGWVSPAQLFDRVVQRHNGENVTWMRDHIISPERSQWMKEMYDFENSLVERGDIHSEYHKSRDEIFARFTDRFVDWVENKSGRGSYMDNAIYSDVFSEAQFKKFVELLQKKAQVDALDGNPHSAMYQNLKPYPTAPATAPFREVVSGTGVSIDMPGMDMEIPVTGPSPLYPLDPSGRSVIPRDSLNPEVSRDCKGFETDQWKNRFWQEVDARNYDKDTADHALEQIALIVDYFRRYPNDLPWQGGPDSAVRKNRDYIASLDVNTICSRTIEYRRMVAEIERVTSRPMDSDAMLQLGMRMAQKGNLSFCTFCYVEAGRRFVHDKQKKYAEYSPETAAQFGKVTKSLLKHVEFRDKQLNKLGKDLKWFRENITKPEVVERLSAKNPEFAALAKDYNKYSNGMGTKVSTNGHYNHEYYRFFKKPDMIRQAFRSGGARIDSFTDLEPTMIPDVMQAVSDLAIVGAPAHTYGKEPYKILIFANTNMKINMSMALYTLPDGTVTTEKPAGKPQKKVTQKYSSAKTSMNIVPSTFTQMEFAPGSINLDLGGGKYDTASQYLAKKDVTNLVKDPFHPRSPEYSQQVDEAINENRIDTVTANNVLNVIKEPEIRDNVIREAAESVKADGTAYFLIHEGSPKTKTLADGTKIITKKAGDRAGIETPNGWQNYMPASDYISEIQAHFRDVTRKGEIIIARDPISRRAPKGPEFVEDIGSGMTWNLARIFSKKYKNCGLTLIAKDDAQAEFGFNSDDVHQIIPVHNAYTRKGQPETYELSEYESVQLEKWKKGYGTQYKVEKGKDKGKQLRPAEVPEIHEQLRFHGLLIDAGNDVKLATDMYLRKCEELGVVPKFEAWKNHPKYYKCLVDYGRIDSPQEALVPEFDVAKITEWLDKFRAGKTHGSMGKPGSKYELQKQKEVAAEMADIMAEFKKYQKEGTKTPLTREQMAKTYQEVKAAAVQGRLKYKNVETAESLGLAPKSKDSGVVRLRMDSMSTPLRQKADALEAEAQADLAKGQTKLSMGPWNDDIARSVVKQTAAVLMRGGAMALEYASWAKAMAAKFPESSPFLRDLWTEATNMAAAEMGRVRREEDKRPRPDTRPKPPAQYIGPLDGPDPALTPAAAPPPKKGQAQAQPGRQLKQAVAGTPGLEAVSEIQVAQPKDVHYNIVMNPTMAAGQRARSLLISTGYLMPGENLWSGRVAARAVARIQNNLYPLWRVIDKAEGIIEEALLPRNDPRILSRALRRSQEKYEDAIEYGHPDPWGGGRLTKPFQSIWNPLGDPSADYFYPRFRSWNAWANAKRTLEEIDIKKRQIEEVRAKVNSDPKMSKVDREKKIDEAEKAYKRILDQDASAELTGLGDNKRADSEVAKEIIAEIDKDPALAEMYEEVSKRYQEFAMGNIEYLYRQGRISQERLEYYKNRREHYVDLHRFFSEFDEDLHTNHFGVTRENVLTQAKDVLKKFKGSGRRTLNGAENLMIATYQAMYEGDRADTMRSIADFFEQRGTVADGDNPEGRATWLAAFGTKVEPQMIDGKARVPKGAFQIWRDGKVEYWRFEDSISRALQNLDNPSPLPGWVTASARLLRESVIIMPFFAIRNVLRDAFERSVVSEHGSKPWDSIVPLSDAEVSQAKRYGGVMGGWYLKGGPENYYRFMKHVLRMKDSKSMTVIPELWNGYKEALASSELRGRMGEYRRAFEYAKNELKYDEVNAGMYAADKAGDLPNFTLSGDWIRTINQVVPFTNAGIQGTYRAFKAFKTNFPRALANFGLYILMPKMLEYMWNTRDEESRKDFEALDRSRRDMFLNFRAGPDFFIKIPLGFEMSVMASGVTRAINAFREKNPDAFNQYTQSLLQALVPMDFTDVSAIPFGVERNVTANYDPFFNKAIYPPGQKGLRLEEREGMEKASLIAQGLSKGMHALMLDEAVGQDLLDPRVIDYWMAGHLTNVYKALSTTVDVVAGKKDPKNILGAWIGLTADAPGYSSPYVQRLFDEAAYFGEMRSEHIQALGRIQRAIAEEKDPAKREALKRDLISFAKNWMENYRIRRESEKSNKPVIYKTDYK